LLLFGLLFRLRRTSCLDVAAQRAGLAVHQGFSGYVLRRVCLKCVRRRFSSDNNIAGTISDDYFEDVEVFSMAKRNGFTLIELLVVIAIIALLMSILAPALTRVREQAKDALCMSRLHQWGAIFNMYAEDNDGHLTGFHDLKPGDNAYAPGPPGTNVSDSELDHEHCWVPRLHHFYAEELTFLSNRNTSSPESWEFCMCPNTEKTWFDGEFGGPLTGWDFRWINEQGELFFPWYSPAHGSYGKNSYVTDTTADFWIDNKLCWDTTRVKGVSRIPLFGDCTMMGGFPEPTNGVPNVAYRMPMESGDELERWCIDRHNLTVNLVFLDFTVRKVGLKQLWQLFWHRNWDLSLAPDPRDPEQWPSWIWPAPMIELGF